MVLDQLQDGNAGEIIARWIDVSDHRYAITGGYLNDHVYSAPVRSDQNRLTDHSGRVICVVIQPEKPAWRQ